MIIPNDPDSKVIKWDNDTISFESKGQELEYSIVNNVINFTDGSLETEVFKSMQRNKFAYWKSRTTKQSYSKYDYQIKMNLSTFLFNSYSVMVLIYFFGTPENLDEYTYAKIWIG